MNRSARTLFLVLCALAVLVTGNRHAIADDPYFIHMTDPHVSATGVFNWERLLRNILSLSPPPDLVLCSGDLVEWGAGITGSANYDLLLNTPSITTTAPGVHYVADDEHQIPIFFGPGNHDYRNAVQLTEDLTNYEAKIHPTTYYHQIVDGTYAIFSLNSGYDTFTVGTPVLPEGSGLFQSDVTQLVTDLDALDGDPGGNDTSSFKKIIFLHHPHQYPNWEAQTCVYDGRFDNLIHDFVVACEDYDVDWVLLGHVHPDSSLVSNLYCGEWSSGQTKSIVSVAAKNNGYRIESVSGVGVDMIISTPVPAVSRWGVVTLTLATLMVGVFVLSRHRLGQP